MTRMKAILTDAANIGAVTARSLALDIRGRDAFFYPDSKSSWRLPFFGGYKFQSQPGVSNLDGAAFYYFFATGVTPAMEEKMVGKGSQYPWTALDADGKPFDGGKTYKLTLPKGRARSRISGRSSSMTSRRARCCRPTRPRRAFRARTRM